MVVADPLPPPAYRLNPFDYIMSTKATLPITGNAKVSLAPLYSVYGEENTCRFHLVWTPPTMGTLCISDVTIDLGPLVKGDYTLAFDLFHPPVNDFTLVTMLGANSGLTSLARPYNKPIDFGYRHADADEVLLDGQQRHITKTEGPSTNRRLGCVVDLGMTFGIPGGSANCKKPHHQLLVYGVEGHVRARDLVVAKPME